MRIALLSTFDILGGASKAAYRLHRGLIDKGVNSKMLVGIKTVDDRTVYSNIKKTDRVLQSLLFFLNSVPTRFYKKRRKELFSPAWVTSPVLKMAKSDNFQIAHLQWINNGFISIWFIKKIKKPIVWTIHDMWIFTGGCHYAGDCIKYITGCENCPVLNSNKKNDLSKWIFNRKLRNWKNQNFTIISPSRWLAECAKQSLILKSSRIEVIPYNINTEVYKPLDKTIARNIMNLPQSKSILLFGATNSLGDKRKGINYLVDALQKIPLDKRNDLAVVVFGSSKPENPLITEFEITFMGEFRDDQSLSIIYSSADVFIAPSLEDNLPLTIMESLACGTPVVAFNIGGMPDMIEHKKNGYLAIPYDTDDLIAGIQWIIEDQQRKCSLGKAARRKVMENYTTDIVIKKYIEIYSSLLP